MIVLGYEADEDVGFALQPFPTDQSARGE